MNYIYGLNKSGISIAKLLIKNKLNFCFWDDNKKVRINVKKIFKNIDFVKPKIENLIQYKNIYLTPAISIYKKKFENLRKKKLIKRDLNLYYENISKQKIIAITGTNGKSTTTKLIGDILKKNNFKTFVGGNIGKPLCDSFIYNQSYKYHVIELSSFQLELIKNFHTTISIILNLSADHMDRYKNMQDYINQKKNIINNNYNGFNIISLDDKFSAKLSKSEKIKNKIIFSLNNSNADIYIKDNFIYDKYFFSNKKILIGKIAKDLKDNSNLQNIIVTYICCKILRIPLKIFQSGIRNFKGLPYRSKIIFESNKLIIINNSKATNIESTVNNLKNLKNVYLIMGGKAKDENFKKLLRCTKNLNTVYIYGESAHLIYKQIYKKINSKIFNKLNNVINEIYKDINRSDTKSVILFAPGCTSFDQYENFEERGLHFDKLIQKQFNI
tara:strand:+ start:381 stop:1706 length:1326 start_codon:yes stop_codon:yes gene_type:complete